MKQALRDVKKILSDEGLTLVEEGFTNGGHIKVQATNRYGLTRTFVTSQTPSDRRAILNVRAEMRRFAREGVLVVPLPEDQQTTQAITMPTNTTAPAPKIQRNILGHAEFYRLCEWLKTADLVQAYTFVEVARRASAGLGFDVAAYSVTTAMKAVGLTLAAPPQRAVNKDRVRHVASELANLLRELGKEPSAELIAIVAGRAVTGGE